MKQLLLIFALFCASYMTVNAQTNTWTGATDNNWGTAANWSLNAVPTAANDVVIPTGKTVILNVAGTTKSIAVQGNSTFTMNSSLSFTNASSFATNTIINVGGASFTGGGTLTNTGTINFVGGDKAISGSTIINNSGIMTFMSGSGIFYMYNTATFNNQASGIIDIQSDYYTFFPGDAEGSIINNLGLIRKTSGGGVAYISTNMTNSGTINVSSGTLNLDTRPKTFNGGSYNVTTGNNMSWNSLTNVSGTLAGTVDGNLYWNNVVSVATTATFNFSGSTALSLASATLNGGGTLTNTGTFNLVGGDKAMGGTTILNNSGTMTFKSGSGIFYMYNTARVNNQASGIINFQSDYYTFYPADTEASILNNLGLIRKTSGDGVAYISTNMINSGTINVSSGTLNLDTRPKTFNGGSYNVTTGNNMYLNSLTNVSGTLTGTVDGNLFWNNVVSVATAATLNFLGSTGLSLATATLNGDGTLTNIGTFNLVGGDKAMGGTTILNNSGTMTFKSGSGIFYMYDTARINNQASGVLDIQHDNYSFYPGNAGISVFSNAGTINKTVGNGVAYISVDMINTGTVSVNTGTLILDTRQKTFNGGIYNVSSGSVLIWNAAINASNTLTGVVNGTLSWNNAVSVATTANFNFTGSSGLSMASASLSGNGVLTNSGTFNFVGGDKNFGGSTVFNNQGTMTYQAGAGIFYMYQTAVFNNEESGVFDIKSDYYVFFPGDSGGQMVNNMGLLKKSAGAGTAYITQPFINSGTIDASSGNLIFENGYNFTNTVDGIVKGTGSLTVSSAANFTNNGTFAPGGSPGTLSVTGDFKSSATSILDVELFGLTPNTGYDVLAITGNAIFAGKVNVRLNFAPTLNAQFIVAKTTGTISQCTLATTTSTVFNGMDYTFSVLCQNNNEVVLKLTNITLGIEDFELSDSSIQLYPNPVRNMLTIKNRNNLQLDNAQITDITGKTITTYDLKNMGLSKEISLENLSTGMYFVKINGLNSSITKRIVKQ